MSTTRQHPPGDLGREPEGAGGSRLRTVLRDKLEWLAVRLAMVDCEFTVHRPPELVAYVAELGGRLSRAGSGGA